MKRNYEGSDSSPKRIATAVIQDGVATTIADEEGKLKLNYKLTRRAIKSADMDLWNTIYADKAIYWPNDDVLREHLKFAIQKCSTSIAIDLINTKVPLKHYLENNGDKIRTKSYISEILDYTSRKSDQYNTAQKKDRYNLIAALLNNGYDLNERYEDFNNTALLNEIAGYEAVEHSVLLIANGAKFKHSYVQVVDGQKYLLESVRRMFADEDNDYDETEVWRVGAVLSSTIMAHYSNTEQLAEVNDAIGLAVGQYFDSDDIDDRNQYMLDSLDSDNCITRGTLLQQIRRSINTECNNFLSYCLYDRLTDIGPSLWSNTVFHTFGWASVAEAQAAIVRNPLVVEQIAERCIARLEEQNQVQQPGL